MLVLRRLYLGADLILFWQTSTDVRHAGMQTETSERSSGVKVTEPKYFG